MGKGSLKIVRTVVCLLLCQSVWGSMVTAAAAPSATDPYGPLKAEIATEIKAAMSDTNTVGVSIALVDNQQNVWATGFGYADKNNPQGFATRGTIYQVGSITKLFTVLAAMQLVEQGRLDIDRPLQQYLPEFSMKSRFSGSQPITARTIMTHHSGIPCDYRKGWYSEQPLSELVEGLHNEYVAYPPNVIYSYSNTAMSVLGASVAKVSGRGYSEYIENALLNPLGMKSSFIANCPTPGNKQMSKCYSNGTEDKINPLRDIPAGGLCSSVDDMARFMEMIFADGLANGRQVVKPETLAETLRVQNKDVPLDFDIQTGLGWGLARINLDGRWVGAAMHDGGINDFKSLLVILPEYKLGVVILSNSPDFESQELKIALDTLKLALKVKEKGCSSGNLGNLAPLLSGTPSPDVTGFYALSFGLVLDYPVHGGTLCQVVNQSGTLQANLDGMSVPLVCSKDGGYIYNPKDPSDEIFFISYCGRKLIVRDNNGRRTLFGERLTPVRLPAQWEKFVGTYEMVNPVDLPEAFRDSVVINITDGFLTWSSSSNLLPVAILPVSDTEGVIAGLGRFSGDTISLQMVNGQCHLYYSGIEYKKTSSSAPAAMLPEAKTSKTARSNWEM